MWRSTSIPTRRADTGPRRRLKRRSRVLTIGALGVLVLGGAGAAIGFLLRGSSHGPPVTPAVLAQGKQLFTNEGCGVCHTLSDAGTYGSIGPNLDKERPSKALVLSWVTKGGGAMPGFASILTAAQIDDVSTYVSHVTARR